jgi:predicted nucleic acid-binding protein
MIIVDTNVLSALMQQKPEPTVVEWLDAQPAETVWITSMTLFEMRYGLKIVTDGQRKALLQDRFEKLVQIDLANRIVVFDVCAADRSAQIAALRISRGRPLDIRDTFIAGIAMAHGAILATRNIKHFDDLPTPVVNRWDHDQNA